MIYYTQQQKDVTIYMTITLNDKYICFSNKVSRSTTNNNGKTYEKYMVHFPNVLYDYLGKPQHIHLKKDGDIIYVCRTGSVDSMEKRLFEVGNKTKTNVFVLPKKWVGINSPTTVNYIFDFETKEISFKFW